MPTDKFDSIINEVLRREGGFVDDPADKGLRTDKGISERSFPAAWADNKITTEEARDIYLSKFVKWPKYDTIPESHTAVQTQLIDYAVNSGPGVATKYLQEILGTKPDGLFGPKTLAALVARNAREVNNLLVVERLKMLGRIVTKNPSQAKFISGWINRSCEFLV